MHTSRYARATGSVTKVERKRGPVYYAKLRLPDADGTQVQRKLGPAWTRRGRPPAGALTRRMAEDALNELITEANRGTLVATRLPADGRTFADAVAEWLRYVEHDKQRRPSTLRDYRSAAHGCLLPQLGADTPLEQITTRTIDQCRERLLADGQGRRSVQKTLVLLHGILARAKRLEWIDSNPAENAERVSITRSGDIPNVLSPEEVLAVAGAAGSEQDSAMILVAAFTGLRLGELRGLRFADVDFALQRILVRGNYVQGTVRPSEVGEGPLGAAERSGRPGARPALPPRSFHRPGRSRVLLGGRRAPR